MKKRILMVAKLLFTLSVFAWVIHGLGPEGRVSLWENIRTADPAGLGMALGTLVLVLILGICRWQCLLRVQGIHLSGYQAAWIVAVGMFFNSFLPGGTGGDVLKAWYAASATPDRKLQAVLSIAVDRLIGLMGLFFLATAVVMLNLPLLLEHSQTKPVVYLVVGGLLASLLTLGLSTQRHLITSQAWWNRVWRLIPGKKLLGQLSDSYNLYGKHPGILAVTLALSICVHLLSIVAAWFVGEAIHVHGMRLAHYLVYFPIINTIAAIPITIGGLGLREKACIFFFSMQGVSAAQATAVSLVFYGVILTLSLLCGALFLAGKPKSLSTAHQKTAVSHHTLKT